jgi:hypothetical protein
VVLQLGDSSIAQKNLQRKLKRLLDDERYGPALVRLNRADQRVILDLIETSDARTVRRELLRLDETRRGKIRERSRARREKVSAGPSWEDVARRARENLSRKFQGLDEDGWIKHARMYRPSTTELEEVANASETEIRAKARSQAPPWNPFWYH